MRELKEKYTSIQSQTKAVNGAQHTYGFARVPAILRDSESDTRKIKILPGMAQNTTKWFNADITEMIESSNGILFSDGTCTGQNHTLDDLEYVEFR